MRPRTTQYGAPPAATSALHILSGLMKAISRDWFTHSSVIRQGFKRWIKMKLREKGTSSKECFWCFEVCRPAHVRASRVGMIKSRHMVKNAGEPWNLTVLIVELCQSQIWNCFRASIFRVQQSSFGRPWLLILKSPWSTWAWARTQSAWQKTSWLAWKLHSEWWHTPRHVACGQATDDRRGQDAPVLPMRGRWSRLRHVWASNQWKNSIIDQWIMAQGPSASVAQRTGEVHRLFLKQRAKAILLGILTCNLKQWKRIVSPVPQLKITLSWQRNLSSNCLFAVLHKAAVNSVPMELTGSLFGSAWIWQSLRPPKFPVPFLKVHNLMSDKIHAETGDVFVKFRQSWHSSAHACTSSWLTNAERDAPAASVKVVVSASCLRGKRPSAFSKLVRYLESPPTRYFPYPDSNQTHEWSPTLLHTIPTRSVKKKNKQTKNYTIVGNFVLSAFCIPFLSKSPWLLCRLDSSGDPHSALTSLMSESMRKPAKPAGSFRS